MTLSLSTQVIESWHNLQENTPLVQCITNTVVQSFTANILLAAGASPAMVDIPGESADFARVASGLLINLGTINVSHQLSIPEAAQAAFEVGTPWVLDPVAIGALKTRTRIAHELLQYRPTAIRGNASEIIALAGGEGGRGTDATASVEAAAESATQLAREYGSVVAVSGSVDLITDGETSIECANGHEILTRVTGAGCSLGACVAAYLSTHENPLIATAAAHATFEVAAEKAQAKSQGPGTFAVNLLDELSLLTADSLQESVKLSQR